MQPQPRCTSLQNVTNFKIHSSDSKREKYYIDAKLN